MFKPAMNVPLYVINILLLACRKSSISTHGRSSMLLSRGWSTCFRLWSPTRSICSLKRIHFVYLFNHLIIMEGNELYKQCAFVQILFACYIYILMSLLFIQINIV